MEYSEEAYQQLLNMRARGKTNYDEDRYTESLKDLGKARKAFETARVAYEQNFTEEFHDLAKKAHEALEHARAVSTHLRYIMEGKIKDPKVTDTMYEMHGYKMKEECDEIFNKWSSEFFGPKGYWTPAT